MHLNWKAPQPAQLTLNLSHFEGHLRIAQLTDLHFGWMTHPKLLEAAVDMANAAQPDVTVLTGDFVSRGRVGLKRLGPTLSRITGRKLAVLGNHDHWVDAAAVQDALEAIGIEVLNNRWTWVDARVGRLAVVGIDDAVTGHDDIEKACDQLPLPAICLSHDPRAAPALWAKGVGLVLSGHTHGGQVHLGETGRRLWRDLLKTPHLSGWYCEGDKQVYVCPGIGAAVFPWRLGRPTHRQVAILDILPQERHDNGCKEQDDHA